MYRKRIGITQKLIKHPDYDEILACLDISWFNLIRLIGALPVPMPLTTRKVNGDILSALKLDGLIFSGGNSLAKTENKSLESKELSKQRDEFEFDLLRLAIEIECPVLGICRGMQLINAYFKGDCAKVDGHVSSRHKLVKKSHQQIIINHNEVNSFHDFAIPFDDLGSGLEILAQDSDENIEAFCHNKHKLLGIMWHPEREHPLKKIDLDLMRKHFEL